MRSQHIACVISIKFKLRTLYWLTKSIILSLVGCCESELESAASFIVTHAHRFHWCRSTPCNESTQNFLLIKDLDRFYHTHGHIMIMISSISIFCRIYRKTTLLLWPRHSFWKSQLSSTLNKMRSSLFPILSPTFFKLFEFYFSHQVWHCRALIWWPADFIRCKARNPSQYGWFMRLICRLCNWEWWSGACPDLTLHATESSKLIE